MAASQKWSRVGRSRLGESEVERGSQKWTGGAKSGLHVIGINLRDL